MGFTLPHCTRCGRCCENIMLNLSPWDLQDRAKREGNTDVQLVAKMLAGRCKGYVGGGKYSRQWVYGPCKNLAYETLDDMTVAICRVRGTDSQPDMCKGFPSYADRNGEDTRQNPSQYANCGYNKDRAGPMLWDYSHFQVGQGNSLQPILRLTDQRVTRLVFRP